MKQFRSLPTKHTFYFLPDDYTYPKYKVVRSIAEFAINLVNFRHGSFDYETNYPWLRTLKYTKEDHMRHLWIWWDIRPKMDKKTKTEI